MPGPRKKPGDAEKVIQSNPGSMTFVGDGIKIFQLLAAKHALKLEEAGMSFRTKAKLRTLWAAALGMPKRATYAQIRDEIDSRVRALEAEHGLNVSGENPEGRYP